MAFVLVQHLDPHRRSMLVELLAPIQRCLSWQLDDGTLAKASYVATAGKSGYYMFMTHHVRELGKGSTKLFWLGRTTFLFATQGGVAGQK